MVNASLDINGWTQAASRSAAPRLAALCAALLLLPVGCSKPSISGRSAEKIIGDHGLGPGQFVHPRAIAAAPDGCIFVVDKTARVQRFSAEGEFETRWQMPQWDFGKPTGLFVDSAGRVLVADTHYHRVMIFDRDGRVLGQFGEEGEGPGQLIFPTDVVVDAEGNYFVSEYGGNDRISRFTPDFKYVKSFGGRDAGEAALNRPQAMMLDADGVLWVADSCNHRICRFSRDGELLGSFGKPGELPGQVEYPYDFAFCPDGSVLVSEFGNNRLQRFDRAGKSLEMWGSAGRKPGQLASPWGVALGKDGRVYVVDYLNHRVQMFRM